MISDKKTLRTSTFYNHIPLYIMLIPFMALFTVLTVLPIIASIFFGFTSFDSVSMPQWCGLDNYFRMFSSDDVFPTVLKNTILMAVITGPIGFLLSFVLAWLVNEFNPTVRTLLSFMFYAPALVGNALYIWQVAFSGEKYGYINSFLLSSGLITEPIIWLKEPQSVFVIVIVVQLWQSMGISFLSNISGLQNIDGALYEAGMIDGIKSRWQELRYITLPGMKHMLLFSAVMQIQSSFSISTVATTLAGYPSVQYSVDTLVSHMNDVGTVRYELGYASAMSVVLFMIMALARILIGKAMNIISK